MDGTLDGQSTPQVNDGLTFNAPTVKNGTTNNMFYAVGNNGPANTQIIPITSSVTGSLTVAENRDITFGNNSYTVISGTLTFNSDGTGTNNNTPSNTMTIAGRLMVTGTINAEYITDNSKSSIVAQDSTYGFLTIDGGRITMTGMDVETMYEEFNLNVNGAAYSTRVNSIDSVYLCDFDIAVTEATDSRFFLTPLRSVNKNEDAEKSAIWRSQK